MGEVALGLELSLDTEAFRRSAEYQRTALALLLNYVIQAGQGDDLSYLWKSEELRD